MLINENTFEIISHLNGATLFSGFWRVKI